MVNLILRPLTQHSPSIKPQPRRVGSKLVREAALGQPSTILQAPHLFFWSNISLLLFLSPLPSSSDIIFIILSRLVLRACRNYYELARTSSQIRRCNILEYLADYGAAKPEIWCLNWRKAARSCSEIKVTRTYFSCKILVTRTQITNLWHAGQQVVLLVTTPVGESFQSIARATGSKLPCYPPVDWSSYTNTALPDLASRLKFTTHYALCVIDRNIWESTHMSLLEKFRRARFWDHPGDYTMMALSTSSKSDSSVGPVHMNACILWRDEAIGNIESGEEIGRTDLSDEEITRGISGYTALYASNANSGVIVYREFRKDWTYMPVFWNCHDLAIRLAYIIVEPSMEVLKFLKRLMILLRQAYYEEVPVNWHFAAGKLWRRWMGSRRSRRPRQSAAVGRCWYRCFHGWMVCRVFWGICGGFKRESKVSVHDQTRGKVPSASVTSLLDSLAQRYIFPFISVLCTTCLHV